MIAVRHRRPLHRALAVLACVAVMTGANATAAGAEPTTPPNEGGSPSLETLRKNLEAAAAGYVEAQNGLEVSQARQAELVAELAKADSELSALRSVVGAYAAQVYRTGRLGTIGAMLGTTSSGGFLAKASALTRMTERDEARLKALVDARRRATDAKAGIDAEIATQAALVAELDTRKVAADKVLKAAGSRTTRGYIDPNSPLAKPAPRNADGSWPRESCSIIDPTNKGSGCLTPRTLHALQQAQANGFNRYVRCFRTGDAYEHPKGRACDFAAASTGFGGTATDGNRAYGDQLASFFVKNARALGVMYVIWFCNIWINGGWKSYSSSGGACGDNPGGDHTNHVHLSVY